MPTAEIIDTFPAFLAFWHKVKSQPIDAQIKDWVDDYMYQWPDLLEKQLDDYASQDLDWQHIARDRVFPFLDSRLRAMHTARENLLEVCAPIHSAARNALGYDSKVLFVIYVGIGCGAGWATQFRGLPAVLFGLENIAESRWHGRQPISGLVAHEVGHLAHEHWRSQHGLAEGSGPWWQLYSEGFAQRCEHLILGEETWHMNSAVDGEDWLVWCHDHRGWLAAEFLRTVDSGASVRPFFGSWFDIRGRKQCGYYLGHELIRRLETTMALNQIALLDVDDPRFRLELARLTK